MYRSFTSCRTSKRARQHLDPCLSLAFTSAVTHRTEVAKLEGNKTRKGLNRGRHCPGEQVKDKALQATATPASHQGAHSCLCTCCPCAQSSGMGHWGLKRFRTVPPASWLISTARTLGAGKPGSRASWGGAPASPPSSQVLSEEEKPDDAENKWTPSGEGRNWGGPAPESLLWPLTGSSGPQRLWRALTAHLLWRTTAISCLN
jgi:hypothetical protein